SSLQSPGIPNFMSVCPGSDTVLPRTTNRQDSDSVSTSPVAHLLPAAVLPPFSGTRPPPLEALCPDAQVVSSWKFLIDLVTILLLCVSYETTILELM
ncbi:hypothetical protein STEG23_021014, partial [Scotinomys teguina]